MMRALNSFNNVIIWPGQTLSFFGVAGPCGQSQGYLPAGVVGGIGYGGGICQASTTLYGTAIRAGLTIVQRRNHSVPSTYVPIGLDAMVDYGSSDLQIRNDYDFPIKIVVSCFEDTLLCKMYGIQPEWFDFIDAWSWYTGTKSASAQRCYYKSGQCVYTEALPASYYW
ncbi:VanW family protein [Gordonibacter massiliensis]|uniref:VanW family protein n=2 Tax=Gordonibacter massiliensis (ex Traore et al. 2017) TaxID=1841863 RepID=A0A842JGH0_9ACTN|nr:VanW family protein [Gordonibacter massiliensis (ex Traore et al. 2017)]